MSITFFAPKSLLANLKTCADIARQRFDVTRNTELDSMKKKTVVVIGGGTAGLTIANNLQNRFDVIVVEKSEHKKYPLKFRIPLFIGFLFRSKSSKYVSKREFTLANGRRIPFFESNVLGGASPINGCVHMLGSQLIWESILKKFNTSYADLVSSYNRLYTTCRSENNKINLMLAPQNSVDYAFIRAINSQGVPAGDMNFSNEENCGPIYDTTKIFFRTSVLTLIQKKKFKILLREFVNRILVGDGGKVTGVETNRGVIKADYVILSAGVIGTCSLLLQEKEHIRASNYMRKFDVGRDVQDHTNLRVNVITKKEIGSLNEIAQSFSKKLSMFIKHCFGVPTLMVGTGATSGVHLDLDGDGKVDTRIHVVQFTETGRHGSDGKYFSQEPGFSLSITPINPVSKGSVSIKDGGVIVDPMYLSNKADLELLKLSLGYCLKLLRSEPFSDIVKEIHNESLIVSDPEKYIYENFFSGFHLIGGAQNLVDPNFMVRGIDGLYICDASIFGEYAASNIHSSVVLISDVFSRKFMAMH